MRFPTASVGALVALVVTAGCEKKQPPQATSTTQGTRLNVGATAMTPEIHINPQDGGATNLQIGNVQVQLPGEGDRGAQADREQEQH